MKNNYEKTLVEKNREGLKSGALKCYQVACYYYRNCDNYGCSRIEPIRPENKIKADAGLPDDYVITA